MSQPFQIDTPDELEPVWVIVGGSLLSGAAGFVNSIMLGFFHLPVSHLSGSVSKLGIDLVRGDHLDFVPIAQIFASFLFGAFLSGLIIGSSSLRPGRRYGYVLLLEGVLLGGAAIGLLQARWWSVLLAAAACGLQNAMASTYRGMILRTTHVSGVVTDIGVQLGQMVRRHRVVPWRLLMLFMLLGGFFTGGVLGALWNDWYGAGALWIAAFGALFAGMLYLIMFPHDPF
ncbi:uncharacterized membrane protein YoaK (UPF0700 family) [Plasticicumulans lactativorans]|uniref:Uncharacterized membrane protein YoaK (UPF0700 family) n=1 Tax=Plasticicumulans lactativorans TaxID=1133106 RepID=A0A4R2L4J3_9GAMM|nr:YoaK family protein [Plasticicumulans lactativorans]TCO77528.1 uncharacterized membrane protein YoaK (UPF0700 family) [Plasticicumulans lactativorans]